MPRPLDEFEKAALRVINEHPRGYTAADLKESLKSSAVYVLLKYPLGIGLIRKEKIPGSRFCRYYPV